MTEQISRYYEHYDEEGRLFRDKAHLPEWLTTIRYFDRLFVPCSHILDACAGTGRYSFYLADKGHIVTACDLVEHNVDIIKSKPDAEKLREISVCNVLDLSRFDENSFDVVL
jgi:Methylase involved in ubiquinone/menaquinone biosynthesis